MIRIEPEEMFAHGQGEWSGEACSLVDCELISIQMNTTCIIVTNSTFNFVAFLTCNLDIYVTADLTLAQREVNLQLLTKLKEMNKDGKPM